LRKNLDYRVDSALTRNLFISADESYAEASSQQSGQPLIVQPVKVPKSYPGLPRVCPAKIRRIAPEVLNQKSLFDLKIPLNRRSGASALVQKKNARTG